MRLPPATGWPAPRAPRPRLKRLDRERAELRDRMHATSLGPGTDSREGRENARHRGELGRRVAAIAAEMGDLGRGLEAWEVAERARRDAAPAT